MNLFEVNRLSFLKIFETHQFKGQLTLPDFMNIAMSLKIYPDLVQSIELENLFKTSAGGSRLTLVEFEELIKKLALKLNNQASQDPFKQFLDYLKIPALNSYGIKLKTTSIKLGRGLKSGKTVTSSSRPIIIKNHVNNKSVSNKISKSSKAKNLQLSKRKSCFDLLDSGIVEYREVAITSRRTSTVESSVKPVPTDQFRNRLIHLSESLRSSMKKDLFVLQPRKLKTCLTIHNLRQTLNTSARLSFLLWKLLI